MSVAEAFAAVESGGVLAGPVRRPANFSKGAVGSIHDDARAQELGFRGGTVAGNIHFEQFPPLLIQALGEDWMHTGSLSLFFINATTDGEPVQAFVGPVETRAEGGHRAPVWMETPDGVRVMEGTAAVGPPDQDSALRQRLKTVKLPQDLRIFAPTKVGDTCVAIASRLDGAVTTPRLEAITEPMACYIDPAILGERVAAPSVAIDALRAVEGPLFTTKGPYVGMFGAIELQFLDGPIFVDHDYLADGEVLALTESPKTEAAWYEAVLTSKTGGPPVARMILLTRLLKGSSPLWS